MLSGCRAQKLNLDSSLIPFGIWFHSGVWMNPGITVRRVSFGDVLCSRRYQRTLEPSRLSFNVFLIMSHAWTKLVSACRMWQQTSFTICCSSANHLEYSTDRLWTNFYYYFLSVGFAQKDSLHFWNIKLNKLPFLQLDLQSAGLWKARPGGQDYKGRVTEHRWGQAQPIQQTLFGWLCANFPGETVLFVKLLFVRV